MSIKEALNFQRNNFIKISLTGYAKAFENITLRLPYNLLTAYANHSALHSVVKIFPGTTCRSRKNTSNWPATLR